MAADLHAPIDIHDRASGPTEPRGVERITPTADTPDMTRHEPR
jgi:hypothetical protein